MLLCPSATQAGHTHTCTTDMPVFSHGGRSYLTHTGTAALRAAMEGSTPVYHSTYKHRLHVLISWSILDTPVIPLLTGQAAT